MLAITFGNVLEWFEIYLFAYWAPVLSKLFFNDDSWIGLVNTFLIFGAGFIARPLGALFFGRIGDLIGRKPAFILSITSMIIPTILMGLLPTYAQIGIYAPWLLLLLRLLQSFPSGGEAPGAFCYLYENADSHNQKFLSSWGGFGNQLGAIFSLTESILMEMFLPREFLLTWGWRISLFSGGLLGLLGIFLRYQLKETPLFIKVREYHETTKETLLHVLKHYKMKIGIGIAYGAINASTFYLIASYIPVYFHKTFGISEDNNYMVTLVLLILTTILLPFFGLLGEKFSCRTILVSCAISIIVLLIPLNMFINTANDYGIALVGFFYIFPITCITALIPYLLTSLFPTPVRFTCVGLSFNVADGIIGGFTPAISLLLIDVTKNAAGFSWFILVCSLVSLISYFKIKK